jgi:hypothetical protein
MEMTRRSKTLDNVSENLKDGNNKSVELRTRYSYYRKAKVLEYYNFLNNFFNQSNSISDIKYYDYNQKYFELGGNKDSDNKPIIFSDGKFIVNGDIVDLASKQLTNITLYISSLRERIKLQTRKNYMKGTTNLLKYIINQYLVDYSKISPFLNENSLSNLKNVL